ncbi:hypothetical protein SLE2022_003870 [Rubroshorea leprosula]
MSSKKKNLIKTLCAANAVCGCAKPKPSDVYHPKPKPKPKPTPKNLVSQHPNTILFSSNSGPRNNSASSLNGNVDDRDTSTSFSFNVDTSTQYNTESETDIPRTSTAMLSSSSPKITGSVAIVKDSDDPYQDFRHSMLQMITENEIYSKEDLQELLRCFLDLNSPHQHDVIVQAFTEIWNEVISESLVVQKPCAGRSWRLA